MSALATSPPQDRKDLPPIDPYKPLPREYWPDTSKMITEDDTPVDNVFSEKQQRLLTEPLYSSWNGEGRPFVAMANVGLFFSPRQPALVPDALLSLDVQLPEDIWEKSQRSYVLWEYGKTPEVVIEIVSNRLGGEADTKMQHYARQGIIYYVVFDPQQQLSAIPLRIYTLQGRHYVEAVNTWLPEAGIGLTLWQGSYEGREETWLRWCNQERQLIPTGAERADAEKQRADGEKQRADGEKQRADTEKQRAEQAEQQAAKLAAKLRELGINPEE
jgi:hypothetical protein